MTVRLIDSGGGAALKGLDGKINYAAFSVDTDNDNTPENPLDLDMTVLYKSKEGTSYTKYSHIYKKIRGLPESDVLFMDVSWRRNTELLFPFEEECLDFIFKDASWDSVWFVYDEDGDCKRWERVELYEPGDLYAVRAASRLGLETKWSAIYGSPKSIRQKYDFGFWLQLYIYHDIIDMARRTGDASLEQNAARAYASSSWELLKKMEVIYQFTPVMSNIVETSLFCHSGRSQYSFILSYRSKLRCLDSVILSEAKNL